MNLSTARRDNRTVQGWQELEVASTVIGKQPIVANHPADDVQLA